MSSLWPVIGPMIERARQHGQGDSETLAHIKACLESGAVTLWAIHDETKILAVIGLELHHRPARKVLWIKFLTGRENKRWVDKLEMLVADYRDLIGAHGIETSARIPLARVLKRRGWREKAVIMALEAR